MLALVLLALAAAPAPAWIGRAVPPPIVASVEADVLGDRLREGVAVSGAGDRFFVGVADSRLDPPEMVLDYELVPRHSGSSVAWLRAGGLTGGSSREIAVDVRLGPGRERAWILRVERGRLRLLRRFAGERIRLSGRTVTLVTARGREVWRFERGAYRLVARR